MIEFKEILGINEQAWMAAGKCVLPANTEPDAVGAYADEWFPSFGLEAEARSYCAGCPVLNKCLAVAMEDATLVGVWGGTTTGQRSRARAKAAAKARVAAGEAPEPPKKKEPKPAIERDSCGTVAGYSQHTYGHETVCGPCRNAWNAYRRDWRAGKKKAA